VKEKIEVGFRGLFFFVSFFWRSKRKKKDNTEQKLKGGRECFKMEKLIKIYKINYVNKKRNSI